MARQQVYLAGPAPGLMPEGVGSDGEPGRDVSEKVGTGWSSTARIPAMGTWLMRGPQGTKGKEVEKIQRTRYMYLMGGSQGLEGSRSHGFSGGFFMCGSRGTTVQERGYTSWLQTSACISIARMRHWTDRGRRSARTGCYSWKMSELKKEENLPYPSSAAARSCMMHGLDCELGIVGKRLAPLYAMVRVKSVSESERR